MIKKIQIERFKSLRRTPLLELGKVNLLTGANGRGKSSLFQAFLSLSQTWDKEAMNSLLANGKWVNLGLYTDVHNVYDADTSIVFHIVTDNKGANDFWLKYDRSKIKPTLIELSDAKVNGKSIFDRSGNTMGSFSSDFSSDFDISLSQLTDYPSLMALRRIHYIAADRKTAPYRETMDESAVDLTPNGSNVLSVLWNNRDQGILDEVEGVMDGILDGSSFHIEPLANELVFTLNSAKDDVLFQPVNVGYGHGYILSVITALLIAKEEDALIIENPEAHLHPAAQAKLMNVIIDYAIKKRLQVFVETHSDHILNTSLLAVKKSNIDLSVEDMQILFFSGQRGENGHYESFVQNLEITQEGHILNPPQQFFEQYAIDLRDLYSSNRKRR